MTNSKHTKKALFSSVIALILCFSMLIGTTFAWFTDEVTSGKNQIVAGNLDIELDYWDGDSWETVNGATNLFTGNLWEPGHTEVVYLKVSNVGTLALKYELGINVWDETGSVNKAGKSFLLSDYIYMGVVEDVNGETGAYADREAAIAAIDGTGIISEGYTDGGWMEAQTEEYLALVVYMPESVGNEANYDSAYDAPVIDLGIKLTAWQKDFESDSFGKDYDKSQGTTYVSDLAELREALANGEKAVLAADITIPADQADTTVASVPVGLYVDQDTVLDLNGHTIAMEEVGGTGAVIYAYNAKLDIIGEGTIAYNGKSAFVIWARNTSDVVGKGIVNIYDATIYGEGAEVTLLYADCNEYGDGANFANYATINVYGGNYVKNESSSNPQDYLNVKNHGAGRITIYGGTFNFDPDWTNYSNYNAKDDAAYITIADGNKVIGIGDRYYVVPDTTADADLYIATADDLIDFMYTANGKTRSGNGGNTFSDQTVVLLADIDMSGYEWTPIKLFCGTFDGMGHTISNLNISGESCVAFFAQISGGAHVQNVNFDNITVTGNHYVGVVFGWEGSEINQSYVTNVNVTNSTITASTLNNDDGDKVGGIGGYAVTTTITGCSVKDTVITAYRDAGGILGYAHKKAVVSGCSVSNVEMAWDNSVDYKEFGDESKANLNLQVGGAHADATIPAEVSTQADLNSAIASGTTDVILAGTTYTMPSISNKNITINGTEGTVITVTGQTNVSSSTITFNGVTINGGTSGNGYDHGYTHATKVVYNDCVINDMIATFGVCEFNNCTFNVTGNKYSVWTWGSSAVSFTGCTFNCDGKALLVYLNGAENGSHHQDVTITDCVFNDKGDGTVSGKAAIELTSTYEGRTYDVHITNTTVNGFDETKIDPSDFNAAFGSVEGANIGTNVWGNKCKLSSEYLNVVIDGVDVY